MKVSKHQLYITGEHYLHDIILGKKKYEGRINTFKCREMEVGDVLKLFEKKAGWGISCQITSLNQFMTFKDMIETLGVLNLLPQLEPLSKSHSNESLISKAIQIYSSFPGAERVHSLGCVAIGVSFLETF